MVLMCRSCGLVLPVVGRSICYKCAPHPRVPDISVLLAKHSTGVTQEMLAAEFGVSSSVVSYIVKIHGSPRLRCFRPLSYFPRVSLNDEWLTGWLLGDGGLELLPSGKSCRAQHSTKYKEYAEYVAHMWKGMGMKHGPIHLVHPKDEEGNPYVAYHVASHVHPDLWKVARRWYPEGVKIIPRDLVVTPTILREWYLGDGNLSQGLYPRIHMGGITGREARFLWRRLVQIFGRGVKFSEVPPSVVRSTGTVRKVRWVLVIESFLIPRFFSYMGSCPLSCYNYKWPQMNC